MDMPTFHPLIPGAALPGDWFPHPVPHNIEVGQHTVIDSACAFKHFYTKERVGLRVGSHNTIWRTAFSVKPGGFIEIGDYCYLGNAALVSSCGIHIGSYVFIAGGVTIADSDFHPLEPAARMADTIALAKGGDRDQRPPIDARPRKPISTTSTRTGRKQVNLLCRLTSHRQRHRIFP